MMDRFALYSLTMEAVDIVDIVSVSFATALLYNIWAFDTLQCTMTSAKNTDSLVIFFMIIVFEF